MKVEGRFGEMFPYAIFIPRKLSGAGDLKARPLRARLSSVETKINILKSEQNLKTFYDNGSNLNVFIWHNWNQKQEEENQLLHENLRVRWKNEKREFIRRG